MRKRFSSLLRRAFHPAIGHSRHIAIVAGGAGAPFALVGLLGAGRANVPDEMRARRFVVVDQAGIVRAEMRTEPDGSAVLRVSDAAGAPRAVLGVSGDGLTRLLFQGRDGAARASLTVAPEDWPALVLFDKQGRRRLALDVGLGGWPFLAMRNEQSEDRAVLELTPQGAPQLLFFDRGGALRWRAP